VAKGAGFEPIVGIAPVRGTASLLSVARALPPGARWGSGIAWRPLVTCGAGDAGPAYRREFCASGDMEGLDDDTPTSRVAFYPYDVYLPYECDWVLPDGPEGEPAFTQASLAALDAASAWHVSRELMVGDTEDENPSLVSTASDISEATPVHPVRAVGLLLDAWSACTQQSGDGRNGPIIHAAPSVVTDLLAHGVVAQIGDVLHGPVGSLVSPGPGYPLAAVPDDGEDGDEDAWVYISGPVEYALSAPEVAVGDVLNNPRLNKYLDWALRQAIHRFDPCCVFAIAVQAPTYANELPA